MADLRQYQRTSIENSELRETIEQVRLAQQVRAAQAAWDAVTGAASQPPSRPNSTDHPRPNSLDTEPPQGPERSEGGVSPVQRVAPAMAEVDLSGEEVAAMDVFDVGNTRSAVIYDLVDHPNFQLLSVTVICLNMYTLALETNAVGSPPWWWIVSDSVFLLFYTVEIFFRLRQRGPVFLFMDGKTRAWQWFDMLLLGAGYLDLAASCISLTGIKEGPPSGVSLVWLLHMTTLLRILRIFRMHRKLHQCVEQLVSVFRLFALILAIIFMACFVLALILTQGIGQPYVFGGEDVLVPEQVQELFSSTTTAMFTLFRLTTLDDWRSVADPLISWHPLWACFFYIFIALVPWTMLSLLTAVASETMISATATKKTDSEQQHKRGKRFVAFLMEEFNEADIDSSGLLNKEEFMMLMDKETVKQEMNLNGMNPDELEKTWDTFDVDGSGELSVDEVVFGFAMLQERLASKHVAHISYAMKRLKLEIDGALTSMDEHINEQSLRQEKFLERIFAMEEHSRQLCRNFEWQPGGPGSKGKQLRNSRATLEGLPNLVEEPERAQLGPRGGSGSGGVAGVAGVLKQSLSRSFSRSGSRSFQ